MLRSLSSFAIVVSFATIAICARAVNVSDVGRQLFEWGTASAATMDRSFNVKYDCKFNNRPTCCSLLTPEENATTKRQSETVRVEGTTHECTVVKKYIPSPYEEAHFKKAEELAQITNFESRRLALIAYFSSDIEKANIWLTRVHEHMNTEGPVVITQDDLDYLSRFQVTKTCTGDSKHLSSAWLEWIEPLTAHARHPFSYVSCKGTYESSDVDRMKHKAAITSVDYLIMMGGHDIHEATTLSVHNHTKFAAHRNHHTVHRADHIQTHNYLFDAGASTFDGSLTYLLCAYLQVCYWYFPLDVL